MREAPALQHETPPPATRSERLREIAVLFFRFGALSFGGPPVQAALMEDELVHRRRWIDRQHFLDLYSAMNVIPGPNSTELAIALGYVRAGLPGLLVAGVCFITPAVLIILPIAWAYARYGSLPQVQPVTLAINAGVLAILAATFWRLITEAVRDAFTGVIAVAAATTSLVLTGRSQPELLVLATAAMAGAIWYGRRAGDSKSDLPLLAVAGPVVAAELHPASLTKLFLAFLKIGGTLYGSGYVLVSYLRSTVVEQHGWLTERELLDGIGVGQITPGPLLTTATFLGYLVGERSSSGHAMGGAAGALVATAGIFLPSFVLVAIFGGVLQRVRHNRWVRGALDGMNAAVAALILVVTLQLAAITLGRPNLDAPLFGIDPILAGVTAVSAALLVRFDLNASWIVLLAAGVGIVRALT